MPQTAWVLLGTLQILSQSEGGCVWTARPGTCHHGMLAQVLSEHNFPGHKVSLESRVAGWLCQDEAEAVGIWMLCNHLCSAAALAERRIDELASPW